MALWTRVKRLRGGRSHMDSQTCFSKNPRCSSAMKIREKLLSSVSPEHKGRLSGSAAQERVPSWGWHSPPLQADIQRVSPLHLRRPFCKAGSQLCLVL